MYEINKIFRLIILLCTIVRRFRVETFVIAYVIKLIYAYDKRRIKKTIFSFFLPTEIITDC